MSTSEPFVAFNFNPPTSCEVGPAGVVRAYMPSHFNPPTSCEVGPRRRYIENVAGHFNPPTSCEVGRSPRPRTSPANCYFNPPTSCEVGRFTKCPPRGDPEISIHPPPARWDARRARRYARHSGFQSTHLLRGGTMDDIFTTLDILISIHPPPARWDVSSKKVWRIIYSFNPPTSCEVGHSVTGGESVQSNHFNPPTSCEVGHLKKCPKNA